MREAGRSENAPACCPARKVFSRWDRHDRLEKAWYHSALKLVSLSNIVNQLDSEISSIEKANI
jgi:hypothetical protein